MKFLLGTHAYNRHVQNIALALCEAEMLGAFYTGLADNYRNPLARKLRSVIASSFPEADAQLRRRRIGGIPDDLIETNPRWDIWRTAASRFLRRPTVSDKFWELGEHYLDRKCARLVRGGRFDAFLGTEFGSLASIREARRAGKKSVVAFLSPHSSFRRRWVDEEYEKFPELLAPSARRLSDLAAERDARRGEEAFEADAIHTNSSLTARSLIEAGVSEEKIIIVPLAGPEAVAESSLPKEPPAPLRFIYAGSVSVNKGAHLLLEAWAPFSRSRDVELHLYGAPLLPERCVSNRGRNVVFHGSVTKGELFEAYRKGAALIFPTLCDGFGMVVTEALAHGLPVITTGNAGASVRISEGRNGFIIPAGSAAAIEERIAWCVANRGELHAMRREALASAGEWTWAHFRESFRQQLCRLLGVCPPSAAALPSSAGPAGKYA